MGRPLGSRNGIRLAPPLHRPTARYCLCAAHHRHRALTSTQRSMIARHAALVRWGRVDASTVLAFSDRRHALEMRRRRAIARRQAAYDGVKYDDRMASSPRVRAAYEHLYPDA